MTMIMNTPKVGTFHKQQYRFTSSIVIDESLHSLRGQGYHSKQNSIINKFQLPPLSMNNQNLDQIEKWKSNTVICSPQNSIHIHGKIFAESPAKASSKLSKNSIQINSSLFDGFKREQRSIHDQIFMKFGQQNEMQKPVLESRRPIQQVLENIQYGNQLQVKHFHPNFQAQRSKSVTKRGKAMPQAKKSTTIQFPGKKVTIKVPTSNYRGFNEMKKSQKPKKQDVCNKAIDELNYAIDDLGSSLKVQNLRHSSKKKQVDIKLLQEKIEQIQQERLQQFQEIREKIRSRIEEESPKQLNEKPHDNERQSSDNNNPLSRISSKFDDASVNQCITLRAQKVKIDHDLIDETDNVSSGADINSIAANHRNQRPESQLQVMPYKNTLLANGEDEKLKIQDGHHGSQASLTFDKRLTLSNQIKPKGSKKRVVHSFFGQSTKYSGTSFLQGSEIQKPDPLNERFNTCDLEQTEDQIINEICNASTENSEIFLSLRKNNLLKLPTIQIGRDSIGKRIHKCGSQSQNFADLQNDDQYELELLESKY